MKRDAGLLTLEETLYRMDDGAVGRTCGFGRGGSRCGAMAFRVRGASAYCLRHHRFHQMRKLAKSRGLLVPTWRQLDLLTPPDMACPACGDEMFWTTFADESGRRLVVSLQHYRDGTIALIHHRCNVIHGKRKNADDHATIEPFGFRREA